MGRGKGNADKIAEFIESIPESKLLGFPSSPGAIHKDRNFRLDLQGLTSAKPQNYNLQVQINRECKISSLKKMAPATVSMVLAPVDMSMTPGDIKRALISSIRAR